MLNQVAMWYRGRLDICVTPECIGWNLISSGMVLGLVPLEVTRSGKGVVFK